MPTKKELKKENEGLREQIKSLEETNRQLAQRLTSVMLQKNQIEQQKVNLERKILIDQNNELQKNQKKGNEDSKDSPMDG
jgi:L-lysine 2,3-aminomutase